MKNTFKLAGSWGCAVAVGIGTSVFLMAQSNKLAQPTSAAQLLMLAADPKSNPDYSQVHRLFASLGTEDRKNVLRQLIGSQHEGLAAEAARRAITDRDTNSAAVIASRIATWRDGIQGAILQLIAPVRQGFREVPRQLIRHALTNVQTAEPKESPIEPVGMAAILMAKVGDQADRQAILDVALSRPRSWGIWMAISYAGIIDTARAKLALTVYSEPKNSLPVRVAAASALEPLDSQAGAFAVSQIESFIAQFDQDMNLVIADARRTGPGGDAARRHLQFKSNYHTLGALLVLKASAADQIVFRNLNSRNSDLRYLCGIVAAMRWPDRLVKAGQGTFGAREYADLMAFVALTHAEQSAAASLRITADGMERARANITRVGLGVFGTPGNMLKIF